MQIKIDNATSVDCFQENRKSLSIRVFPDLSVIIKVPFDTKDAEIVDFVHRKSRWISKQMEFFKQFDKSPEPEIQSGKSLLYLGRQYQLIVQKAPFKNRIKIEKNRLLVLSSAPDKKEDIKNSLENWFLQRCKVVFAEQLKNCLKQFPEIQPPNLKIRKLNKRWGSYLQKHEIILNPILIQASKSSINYIITHELCHFHYRAHNTDFYDLLTSKIPNWRKIDEKLEIKLLGK